MAYIDSKSASIIYGVSLRALSIACQRHSKRYPHCYEKGVGRGGKRLFIWVEDKRLGMALQKGTIDEKDIVFFEKGKGIIQSPPKEATPPLPEPAPTAPFTHATSTQQEQAVLKRQILREWEKAKENRLSGEAFCLYVKERFSLSVTLNQLYSWQRRFKAGGLDGLIDRRGKEKGEGGSIEELGLTEVCNRFILAQQGRFNIANIHKAINYHLMINEGRGNVKEFLAKRDEVVSYDSVYRYTKSFLEKNRLIKEIVLHGEDGVVGRNLPALGKSNWAVDSINQVVEIDASPLDVICNVSSLVKEFGVGQELVEVWQKRYCIIGLVDTYSGVCTLHIADTENSISIARAIAKYITRYGKPRTIKGDNGKAFLSKYTQGVLERLDIEYKRVKAYSGWLKPYVERNFRTIQHQFTEWLRGYIGHNVSERQAIEFFASKKERRLARGEKTNLKNLMRIVELEQRLDSYCEKILANTYKTGRGGTPKELYDERASEAVGMSPLSLALCLAPLEERRVGKEGVMLGGVKYYAPTLFNYSKVYVAPNLNNINEIFLLDEQKQFIDIAQTLRPEAITVEEAKQAQQAFKHHLKANKKAIKEAREASVAEMDKLFELVNRELEAPKAPTLKPSREEKLLEIASAQAKNRRTSNINEGILELAKAEKREERRSDYSFEKAVLGA